MNLARRVLKSPFWRAMLAVLAIYVVLAVFTRSKPLIEAIRLVSIPIFTTVVIAFAGPALRHSVQPKINGEGYLTLGIAVSWFGMLLQALLFVLWRLAGQPAWLANNDFAGWISVLTLSGAVLHILAPGAIDGVIPRRNMIVLGAGVGLALTMLVSVLAYTPDVSRFVNMLRPYLDDGPGYTDYEKPTGLRLEPKWLSPPLAKPLDVQI